MYKCYDYIFGFTRGECACDGVEWTEEQKQSTSGLFLDDLAPIDTLLQLKHCEGSLADAFGKARNEGVAQLVKDTNALLGKKYVLKREPLASTALGTIKAKELASVSKNYTVTVLSCSPIRSGYLTLEGIGAVFSGTGAISVALYDNEVGLIDTFPINTVANKLSKNTVNKVLPMYSKYVGAKEYYFVVEYDEANAPKDNLIKCGCGNWTPEYNKAAPYYNSIGAKKSAAWSDYVMVGGTQVNSVEDLDEIPDTLGNEMYGLVIELKAGCNVSEVLCKDSLDFVGNPLALSLAFAARYATAVIVAKDVMKSNVLTRENMVDIETWETNAAEWENLYNQHVNFIVNKTHANGTDCLTCRDIIQMTRAGLFS